MAKPNKLNILILRPPLFPANTYLQTTSSITFTITTEWRSPKTHFCFRKAFLLKSPVSAEERKHCLRDERIISCQQYSLFGRNALTSIPSRTMSLCLWCGRYLTNPEPMTARCEMRNRRWSVFQSAEIENDSGDHKCHTVIKKTKIAVSISSKTKTKRIWSGKESNRVPSYMP